MTELKNYLKPLTGMNAQLVTGVCCQWRGSASYDSDVHFETFVLRGKFSGEIATEQQPPIRYVAYNLHSFLIIL
jgi:hypothetical protein